MTLEAKCLGQNSNAKIASAHEKLSAGGAIPSGIRELINILAHYNTQEANGWQQSLLEFWRAGYRNAARYDGVAYATGHIPVAGDRQAWLPGQPHPQYTANRHLEGIEFQFGDLDALIDDLYR